MDRLELPGELARFGQEVTIREGRAFFWQDDAPREAYWLARGRVRPVKFASDGKPFDLPELSPPCWIGLAEITGGLPCLFDAVALTECRAIAFSKRSIELALARGDTASFIALCLSREVFALHRLIASADAREKIIAYLASRRASIAGLDRARLMLTQATLAEAVGLSRETVNRQLKELESGGLVTLARGEIGVPDWDALEKSASRR